MYSPHIKCFTCINDQKIINIPVSTPLLWPVSFFCWPLERSLAPWRQTCCSRLLKSQHRIAQAYKNLANAPKEVSVNLIGYYCDGQLWLQIGLGIKMTGCRCYATFSYRHEPCVKSIGTTYFCGGAHAWTISTLLFTPIVISYLFRQTTWFSRLTRFSRT